MGQALDLSVYTEESRVASLTAILDDAKAAARESGLTIQVIHSPLYVDEYAEGEHVYGPHAAVEIMYRKPASDDLIWHVDATIDRKGNVLLTRPEDATRGLGKLRPNLGVRF